MVRLQAEWIRPTLMLLSLLPLQACALPLTYSARPITGYVVDADTKAPIAGAVIVADWVLMVAGGGDRVRSLQTIETVTDWDGHYSIPGWGPKLRPTGVELTDSDPKLIVFKSTYVPEFLYNKHERATSVRGSDWDGKTIALKAFRGTQEKRIEQLGYLIGDGISLCRDDPGLRLRRLHDEIASEARSLGAPGNGLLIRAEGLRGNGL